MRKTPGGFIGIILICGGSVLLALAGVALLAHAQGADVGLVNLVVGDVMFLPSAGAPAKVQAFMRLRDGDVVTLPAGGQGRWVFFDVAPQERGPGPASFRAAKTQSEPLTGKPTDPMAVTQPLTALGQPLTDIQTDLLARQGYPDAPSNQPVFFGERGSQWFKGYALLDVSFNYEIALKGHVRPWVKFDVFNLFNHKNYGSFTLVETNANYGKPAENLNISYQPRLIQFGFRASF